jgi:hypothetical protein
MSNLPAIRPISYLIYMNSVRSGVSRVCFRETGGEKTILYEGSSLSAKTFYQIALGRLMQSGLWKATSGYNDPTSAHMNFVWCGDLKEIFNFEVKTNK